MPQPLRIATIEALLFRFPVPVPVTSAIGTMTSRPMLLVHIEDTEGAHGWGEIWCNFPLVGAEHRAQLIKSVFEPLLVGHSLDTPAEHFERLTRVTRQQVVQTGEPGTFAQCIAGIDQALTDLAARRCHQPLWRFLGGENASIPAYASALGPDSPGQTALEHWELGFRHFKLKVGLGRERDLRNLSELRTALPSEAGVMVDANQAWSGPQAIEMIHAFSPFDLTWVEEPVTAEASLSEWSAIAAQSSVPLAAGENLRDHDQFGEAIRSKAFGFIQPDIGKWGGFTGGLEIGRNAVDAGLAFCPHWLAGGIGLLASMHLLAAVGGDGFAEIDANPNPLRDAASLPAMTAGYCTLSEEPGLGLDPALTLLPHLDEYRVR